MDKKPFRSQRSIDAELRAEALADAEQTRLERMNSFDAMLDLVLNKTLTIDEMKEDAINYGLIEHA